MSLRRLSIQQFRNIKQLDIEFSPGVNLFFGLNGSGKTSILEAIALLSLGRSFRSRKTRSLINYDADRFTVFGQLSDSAGVLIPMGITKDLSGGVQIKKGGTVCQSAAALAEAFPVRVLDGHSFQLLEGSPVVRRQFIDWLVFHVEPDFLSVWRDYEKCLKQRNILIRHAKIDRLMLETWEKELARSGMLLHQMRSNVFEQFHGKFVQQSTAVLPDLIGDDVALTYQPGWSTDLELLELFSTQRQRDVALGYTLQGPHRADFQLSLGRYKALDVLSRGQQKLIISALFIAQSLVLSGYKNIKATYLIDDLPAELDSELRRRVAGWMLDANLQLFMTGVDKRALTDLWGGTREFPADSRVFHVKHGCAELHL